MSKRQDKYIGIQVNKGKLMHIEIDVPDYKSFDYNVKVITHDTGFSNWYQSYEVYDKDQQLTSININGWETRSHFKQEGSSWNGGAILKTDITDSKGIRRIIDFTEMYARIENIQQERLGTVAYKNFGLMIEKLAIFFNTFSNWDEYDKNNTIPDKEAVIRELQEENKKLREVIQKVQELTIIKDITD